MKWSEIVQLSKQSGINCNTIKHRLNRGLAGADLVKPPKAGNFQITEQQAREIWQDIQHYAKTYPARSIDITAAVASYHGVSYSIVENIRYGGSWNRITGLPKRQRSDV